MILAKKKRTEDESISTEPLFLGLRLTEEFQRLLRSLDVEILNSYINEEGVYLSYFSHQGALFLGKFVLMPTPLDDLKLLENNIYSILKKIIPNFLQVNYPLEILPITKK